MDDPWTRLLVLPECNRGRKPAGSEALLVITLMQIDKTLLCIYSPKHPQPSKILHFLSKTGGTEIFRTSATMADSEAIPNIASKRYFRVAENFVVERMP
jgi:hypothetical protein